MVTQGFHPAISLVIRDVALSNNVHHLISKGLHLLSEGHILSIPSCYVLRGEGIPQLIDSGIKDDSEHSFRVCLKELVQRLLVIFLIGLIEYYFMNCQVIIFLRYITS